MSFTPKMEKRILKLKGSHETIEQFISRVLDKYEGRCGRCGDLHPIFIGCSVREDQDR